DSKGAIAFFNAAAEKITGISCRNAMGKDPAYVLPGRWPAIREQLDQGTTIIEQETLCDFFRAKAVPVSISAARIVTETGRLVGNWVILRDLREVKRLQEEIRRKEKLAALGGLAAGVAHEIRNPLSSIKGIATYFGDKYGQERAEREMAEVMIREVDRLNRVISELLEFARPTELNLAATDVYELLNHAVQLVQQDANLKHIDISIPKGSETVYVKVDPDRFLQCMLNLFLNAIEAMPEGGLLRIVVFVHEDERVDIEITDTGRGIDAESLHRIFDPYFTTKTTGTGLGLAIVHKIIEAHHGRIRVRSTLGKGTTFTISVPASTD
ncbi:MAG: ATP-binding protein, partial [Deltaproteobacteria bacterium]